MEIIVNTNSYMTLEEANLLIEENFLDIDDYYTTWNQLSDTNKIKLILIGTKKVDKLMFIGTKYHLDSTLAWPRSIGDAIYECPYDIKIGLLKEMLYERLNNNTEESKLIEAGVKSYSVKNASITFNDNIKSKISDINFGRDIYIEHFNKWVY